MRDQLKLERAGFTAEIGGFDTHGTFDSQTQVGFAKINKVIKTFKEEEWKLKMRGMMLQLCLYLTSGVPLQAMEKEPTMVSMTLTLRRI